MAARIGAVVLLVVLIISAVLVASPAEARAVPDAYAAANDNVVAGAGRARRGRWNMESLEGEDAARKREVPGGPDPEHHN
jgi:hypothetical protein